MDADFHPGIAATSAALSGDSDFGSAWVGTASSKTYTLINTNLGTIRGLSAHFESLNFASTLSGCEPLSPGASCSITVAFSPTSGGEIADTLTVSWAEGNSVTAPLEGVGIDTLIVTSFESNLSGFQVVLNKPLDTSVFNLRTGPDDLIPQDITIVGDTVGSVQGSVILDSSRRSLRFVKRGGLFTNDTYTVTLRSATDGVRDLAAQSLDGTQTGTPGGDYTQTFTIASSAVAVTLSDFARGPGQQVKVPNNTGTGIPVSVSNGNGVTTLDVDLEFDPTLLTVSGATVGAAMPGGSSVSFETVEDGHVRVQFVSPSDIGAGVKTLFQFLATVPTSATFAEGNPLILSNASLNSGSIAAAVDVGVHQVVYMGDVDASRSFTAGDGTLTAALGVLLLGGANPEVGFEAFPLFDPFPIGDISGDGTMGGFDASLISQKANGLVVAQIPDIP